MIHVLFEQSNTFRDVFNRPENTSRFHAYAVSYDIEDTANIVGDIITPLAAGKNPLLCDASGDRVIAFFPCTYFSQYNDLIFSGESTIFRAMTEHRKEEYIRARLKEYYKYATAVQNLVKLCKEKKYPLIIENPASCTIKHLLGAPTVAHERGRYGDRMCKRTYWYMYNGAQLHTENMTIYPRVRRSDIEHRRGLSRSLIAVEYAENFINNLEW